MNVLNVDEVERELYTFAAQCIHSAARVWVMSVPRNYLLSGKLEEKDMDMNFRVYTRPVGNKYTGLPPFDSLPDWAKLAVRRGETLHYFDTIQVLRRPLWQALDAIVSWFNQWPATDTRLKRLDRINFNTAATAAAMWFKDIQENIWSYVKDKPPVVARFDEGFYWVKLVTALHFEREGNLMGHCIGNGGYYTEWVNTRCAYYSLRDRHNNPHCSVEVSLRGETPQVKQCKGKGNQKPIAAYQRFIRPFFDKQGWAIAGDQMNIDPVKK